MRSGFGAVAVRGHLRPRRFSWLVLAAVGLALGFGASAHAQVDPGSVVQIIDSSLWTPPSPDPSGISYRPDTGQLLTCDAEVEETVGGGTLYQGANVWTHTNTGGIVATATTVPWSNEPTGISFDPAGGRLFIADDIKGSIFEVSLGADGSFGTADDSRVRHKGYSAAGCDDIEDVTYDNFDGHLYIAGGGATEICRIGVGGNGFFDGAPPFGDDTVVTMSVAAFGLTDPEGIVYDPFWNTLVLADRGTRDLYELTPDGNFLRKIDVNFPSDMKPSGVTIAPGSTNPALRNYFVTDRHVDNDFDPTENDGRIFEVVAIPLGGNGAPVVDAGPPQTVQWPTNNVDLDGFVSDDGHPYPPSSVAVLWSKQSGPGSVTFGNPNSATTTASLSAPGSYVLQLVGNDSALASLDTVAITLSQDVTLSVSSTGPGAVMLDPPGGVYTLGEAVHLTAVPNPDAAFNGWSGDLSGTTNPAMLVLGTDESVTASFVTLYELTVASTGAGSVTLDPPGGVYEAGSAITLTAVPARGYFFNGWSGDASGAANPLLIVMDADYSVDAEFKSAGGSGTSCGIGPELVALLPPLGWLLRRRRKLRTREAFEM
jgi:hypothetical protein